MMQKWYAISFISLFSPLRWSMKRKGEESSGKYAMVLLYRIKPMA